MSLKIHTQNLPKQNNSWYLRTGYIHHYICKCGEVDQFVNIAINIHHPYHSCSRCKNTHYLDSVMFLNDSNVVRWSSFHWNIETIKSEESWSMRAYSTIPVFDYDLQKIRLKRVTLATTTLYFNGTTSYKEDNPMIMEKYVYNNLESMSTIKELVDNDLEESLCRFILESPIDTTKWIQETAINKYTSTEKLKLFSFFLQHPHLKEYDFFHWDNFAVFETISKEYNTVNKLLSYVFNNRKEKSIKKAYFNSYIQSMQINGSYNYIADYIFSHHITDRNFLLELICIDVKIKHVLFNDGHFVLMEELLAFLKEYYTERAITKLFTNLEHYTNAARDTIWIFQGENKNNLKEHFRKVPLSFRNLHNEFIRIQNLIKVNYCDGVTFEYHENDLKAEGQRGEFTYVLPKTTHTLSDWGRNLHNCMASYSREIHKKKLIIFVIFKEKKILYAIEIRGSKIVQALGKYNQDIEEEDRKEIDEWLNKVYIQGWMKLSSES